MSAPDTYPAPAHGWTCFHCGETFPSDTMAGQRRARDHFGADPSRKPGCLIRIEHGDERGLLMKVRRLEAELGRLRDLINSPHVGDFIESVRLEAAHQVERWGADHDKLKTPEDWLWTVAYLTTKASQAARYGDRDKYLHHIVTTAAVALNWHRLASAPPSDDGAAA